MASQAPFFASELNLKAHELIKVRVGDSRENRIQFLEQICTELEASQYNTLKLLVIYRGIQMRLLRWTPKGTNSRRPAPRKTKRSFQG